MLVYMLHAPPPINTSTTSFRICMHASIEFNCTQLYTQISTLNSQRPLKHRMGSIAKGTVCVTGAAGYIGSWLVKRLLKRGYIVRATVRNPGDKNKVKCLLELPYASQNLTIWKADLTEDGSFDEAIQGCEGVFHVATPMDFESQDPENKMIKPTIEGVLSIIRSCVKAKTVKRLVYTSSAGTVNVEEHQKPLYDEINWSDLDFIRSKKMTGWMYFVSKLLAEKEAWKAAKENHIDFISVIPTLVVGPFIVPSFPPSLITALSLITGNEAHYSIIKQGQYVHLDDLCESHIFLYEDPTAEGRYVCSSHDATIHELAKMIREKWPEYYIPELKGIDENIPVVSFSSKKLIGMGFQYKYTLEDMFKGAIESCRTRGLIPRSTQIQANGKDNDLKGLIPRSTQIQGNGKVNDLKGEALIAQFQANGKQHDLKGLFQRSTQIHTDGKENDLVFTAIRDQAKGTEGRITSQI